MKKEEVFLILVFQKGCSTLWTYEMFLFTYVSTNVYISLSCTLISQVTYSKILLHLSLVLWKWCLTHKEKKSLLLWASRVAVLTRFRTLHILFIWSHTFISASLVSRWGLVDAFHNVCEHLYLLHFFLPMLSFSSDFCAGMLC